MLHEGQWKELWSGLLEGLQEQSSAFRKWEDYGSHFIVDASEIQTKWFV